MAVRVRLLMPEGPREFYVYNDSREMTGDFLDGVLAMRDEIIYRGMLCEIIGQIIDVEGCKQLELLLLEQLGRTVTIMDGAWNTGAEKEKSL